MSKPTVNRRDIRDADARAAARRRRENQHDDAARRRFRWGIWIVAAILLAALIVDLRYLSTRIERFQKTGTESRQGDAADIEAGMTGPRYTDPSGYFSLVPPRHWKLLKPSTDKFYNAVFRGPYDMEMSIQVVVTQGMTFEQLITELKQIERRLSADTHMDFAYVGPYRAIKRSAQLFQSKVLMLDFVTGNLAHHIQFSIPPQFYDEYEPVFLRLMQTYEPGRIIPEVTTP